jgi:hypothetical protein
MVTEQGKWLDGEAIFFEQTCETQHWPPFNILNYKSECIPRPDLSLFIPIYRDLSGFYGDCRELQITNMIDFGVVFSAWPAIVSGGGFKTFLIAGLSILRSSKLAPLKLKHAVKPCANSG